MLCTWVCDVCYNQILYTYRHSQPPRDPYLLLLTSTSTSRPLAADAARELDVLGHDGDALGVDSAEVGVFEEAYEIGFSSFLEGEDCRALPSQVLEVLRDLFDKTLERGASG